MTNSLLQPLAAVFDLDGTLVDNMTYHGDSWLSLSRRLGSNATREDFELRWAGKTSREIFPLLLGREVGEAEAAALEHEKESAYRAAYAPYLAPVAGLIAFLDRLETAGVRLAIASAAPRENREFVLYGLSLGERFPVLSGPEPGVRGKPHPDLFARAAERLAVAPERCIAFEDAVNGVESARAAGAEFTVSDYTALPAELERLLFG